MVKEKVSVIIKTGDHEETYFKEREKEKIIKLREQVEHEANQNYREEHKNHCFRCGTQSLAEVTYGSVTVDICVNKNCGALHLDPGELQTILDNQGGLDKIRKTILSIFK
ncbi:MAG: hypothetical protein HGB33_07680 [Syntrophaceae bacterium]|nr:hypothetical protein [Syntrophaceae bacterium]